MMHPIGVHPDIRDTYESAGGTMKDFSSDDLLYGSVLIRHAEIEIQNLLPHRRQTTEMALLSRVLLRDLQLDCFIGLRETTEEWRHRLANLKINRTVLDLDDYVVIELAVERMEDVVSSSGTIVLQVAPIQVVVVHERAVENDAPMGRESARYCVRRIGGRAAVAGGTGTSFRIRLHHKTAKVRNRAINLIDFAVPPFTDRGIQWIERVESPDRLWAAQIDA